LYPLGTHPVFGTSYAIKNLEFYLRFALLPIIDKIDFPHFYYNTYQLAPLSCIVLYFYIVRLYFHQKDKKREISYLFLLPPLLALVFHIFYWHTDLRFFIPISPFLIVPASNAFVNLFHKGKTIKWTNILQTHIRRGIGLIPLAVIVLFFVFSSMYFYIPALLLRTQDGYWYKDAAVSINNTEKNAVIVTNIHPLIIGYYSNRTVIPLSDVPKHEFPVQDDRPILDKILVYISMQRPLYLVVEKSISWSSDAARNLHLVITNFALHPIARLGDDESNVRIYTIDSHSPQRTTIWRLDSFKSTWIPDVAFVNYPAGSYGLCGTEEIGDFWFASDKNGYEISWNLQLETFLVAGSSMVTVKLASNSKSVYWKLAIHATDGKWHVPLEGYVDTTWQTLSAILPDRLEIDYVKVYMRSVQNENLNHLYFDFIEISSIDR